MARAVLGDPAVDQQYASLAATMDEYIEQGHFRQLSSTILEDLLHQADVIASEARYYLRIRNRQSASWRATQVREAERLRDARNGITDTVETAEPAEDAEPAAETATDAEESESTEGSWTDREEEVTG